MKGRGFTLIEMMVALAVVAVTVMFASSVARSIIFGSERSRMRSDLSRELDVVLRQLRADLDAAGLASGGLIAVDPSVPPWTNLAFLTPNGGFQAIPVIAGADNLGSIAVGPDRVRPGSDALQIVVPNAMQETELSDWAYAGSNAIVVEDGARLAACSMVYLGDLSGPGGIGRSQILVVSAVTAGAVQTRDTLAFDVAPRSQISCARVSTYWLDDRGWLRRTDLNDGGGSIPLGPGVVLAASSADGTDRIAPAAVDLQISYRVSAELFRAAGTTPPSAPEQRWGYSGVAPVASAQLSASAYGWAEVREVRVSILGRNTRALVVTDEGTENMIGGENGPTRLVPRSFDSQWITAAVSLENLRLFDQRMPTGTSVEPY